MAGRRPDWALRLALFLAALVGASGAQGALAVFNDSASAGDNTFTTGTWICSGTGSQTVIASADSWVDESSINENHGSATELSVRSASSGDGRTFVTFVLPALPPACSVTSATLRLYNAAPTPLRTIQAIRVATGWTESGITWSGQPGTSGAAATSTSPALAGWQTWTVTAQVQAMYAGANNGFMVRDASEGALLLAQQRYRSREAGSNLPELVVSWG